MERLDAQEICKAENLMIKFTHRAEEVVNLMFGDHDKIEIHGDTYLSEDGKTVIHYYWDGYDAEPYDNCSISFPFYWLNMNYEDLKAIKPKFWEEETVRRKKVWREERKKAEKESEENARAEYERLKKHLENYGE